MQQGISALQAISNNDLQRLAGANNYQRGQRKYIQGRTDIERLDPDHATVNISSDESGDSEYRVDVDITPKGQLSFSCDCTNFDGHGPCEHVVAAVLALKKQMAAHQRPTAQWESTISQALQTAAVAARKSGASAARPSILAFSLQKRSSYWSIHLYSLAASRFANVALDDANAIAATIASAKLSLHATRVRTVESPSSSAARFVNLSADERRAAILAAGMAQQYGNGYYSYGMPDGVAQILPLLNDRSLVYVGGEHDPLRRRITIRTSQPGAAGVRVATSDDGSLRVQPTLTTAGESILLSSKTTEVLVKEPIPFLLISDSLFALAAAPSAAFYALLPQGEIRIPPASRARFIEQYLMPLAEQLEVGGDAFHYEVQEAATPEARLYLSEELPGANSGAVATMRAQLRFAYNGLELPYDAGLPIQSIRQKGDSSLELVRIIREPTEEQRRADALVDFGLKRDTVTAEGSGWFRLRARTDAIDFLMRQAPMLVEAGYSIYGEAELTHSKVNRNRPTLSLRVSSGIDWFDVDATVQFGEVEASLKDLRQAVRRREKFVKLADGSIGMIPDDWLERYRHLFALSEETEDGMRLSTHHALLLDQAIEDAEGNHQADLEFSARKQRLRDGFASISEQALPDGLNATLYPYQKSGYDWLHFLHEYGFGGCLADDMGLGKTITALAFLLSLRRGRETGLEPHAKSPDLIVVPRSLLFNWEREANRFTPDFRILTYADGSRAKDPEALGEFDIVLTTYGILLRDIEMLRKYPFHYAILDEAQAVKNPLSQTSRASRLLTAEHRLTLTGTPVENSALELWSQFAFLNPGLLGSLEGFKDNFAGAIERNQDEQAAATLRQLIQPFLLRRTKDQVARELPPRTERVTVVDMDAAQKKVYTRLRDQYRAQVLGLMNDGASVGGTQMKILEGLLRLRQICNHPKLVEADYKGDSAKFAAILETMETLRAEGHKALVFSQFVQMLTILREALDSRGIPYAYLDGRTRDRQARVDRFQNEPELPFFLISLKAGGVGLNLTAADYVLHVDPWWNPAVEQQATDRAHRIGQTKPVFVDKFIVKDTVEEKILVLQERKRSLANQLISTEEGFFKSLTRDDIEALFS